MNIFGFLLWGAATSIYVSVAAVPDSDTYAEFKTLNKFRSIRKRDINLVATRKDISIYLFKNNTYKTAFSVHNLGDHQTLSQCRFNTSKETVFIVHGWKSNSSSALNLNMKDTILKNHDVIVALVEWGEMADNLYAIAQSNTRNIGKYLGAYIGDMCKKCNYSLSKIRIIGHSLGAHIGGIAGSENNGSFASIMGLDPARPLFLQLDSKGRLSKDDAQMVGAIHTTNTLGVNYDCGHSDYYVHGGKSQVGCSFLNESCSHNLANDYYTESIGSKRFIARKCDKYSNYQKGNCKNGVTAIMGGYIPYNKAGGRYFLDVNPNPPYAIGYA